MSLLRTTMVVPTGRFAYDGATKTFVADASDFGPMARPMFPIDGPNSILQRIYDDACDVGMTLISDRTLKEVTYAFNSTHRDGGGDVVYWELVPCPESLRECPRLEGTRVLIFNT